MDIADWRLYRMITLSPAPVLTARNGSVMNLRLAQDGKIRHDRGDRIRPLIERHFVPFFDKTPIDAITDADPTRYIARRKAYWTTGPGKDLTHLEYIRAGKRMRRPATEMQRIPSLSRQRREAVVLR